MLKSHHQNAGVNEYFENVAKLEYLETAAANQN
jgi:hypothetical protein